jgi:ASC-1-like (ASCH) protein
MNVKVADLYHYNTLQELVNITPIKLWGPRFKDKQQLLNTSWPYDLEKIKKYGLLAIYVEFI